MVRGAALPIDALVKWVVSGGGRAAELTPIMDTALEAANLLPEVFVTHVSGEMFDVRESLFIWELRWSL